LVNGARFIDEELLVWLSANKQSAWMSIPVLAFLEACPGLGLLASGILLLSVATFLYSEQLLILQQLLPMAFAGACIADHLGFYVGRGFGAKFHATAWAKKRAAQLNRTEGYILNHGASAILIGRFVPAIRSLVPIMVGGSGISKLKFSLIDVLACALWSSALGLLVVGLETLIP
jgi:membrane protein DedA with SNARE-associated domain|tara:strand:+ start:150 stop:674 length:525 start_codon:yes stop_codon:yes gene_type:complete